MSMKSYLACWLMICLVILPGSQALAATQGISATSAAELVKNEQTGPTDKKASTGKTVQKKAVTDARETTDGTAVKVDDTMTEGRITPKTGEPAAEEKNDEGLSTLQWVGIGAGAAAVAVGIAALSGSLSSDSGPSYPTEANIVGSWRGQGTCLEDGRTYDGTYTFYAGGTHIYNLLLSDGAIHRGRGTWFLTADSYAFEIHNASGSAYRGNFAADNYGSVTLYTTDGRWMVTLTKK